MSMSCTHLRSALDRPPPPAPIYPRRGSQVYDLEQILRDAQNRFKAPHKRDYGYRLPVPFRWGPNGSLLLLAGMLGGYGAVVGFALLIVWVLP